LKINLNEKEIHQAIIEFIGSEGIDLSEKQVNIELTAGRKPNGFYADVEIGEPDDSQTEVPTFAADENIGTEEDQPALDI
jgi:6-phosphogluconolactonase/glucosamine-6-phosphate isomerase/deaminase